MNGIHEVVGSTPIGSTIFPAPVLGGSDHCPERHRERNLRDTSTAKAVEFQAFLGEAAAYYPAIP